MFAIVRDRLTKSEAAYIRKTQRCYLDTLIYAPLLSGECARLATQMGVHAASGARNYVSIGAYEDQ